MSILWSVAATVIVVKYKRTGDIDRFNMTLAFGLVHSLAMVTQTILRWNQQDFCRNFNGFTLFIRQLHEKYYKSFNPTDLKDFPKLSVTYYVLLEVVAQDHIDFLASLEPTILMYILTSVSEGLNSHDSMIGAGCCATLDHIVSSIFKHTMKKYKIRSRLFSVPLVPLESSERILQTVEQHPEILQRMLGTVLNIVMFEDCRNQWSMSRPLLALILSNEEYFGQLRDSLIRSQAPDKQANMSVAFEKLMKGIDRRLDVKNRDRFTQNLAIFRKDLNDSLRVIRITNSKDSGNEAMMNCV
ncbi:unnamed protein product [Orchesella dallaii]|uniref:Exportin-7 n=1 Tax=Orchesella dallaii TaxID=48710 RepID=A0ABP1S1D1_9HEXA